MSDRLIVRACAINPNMDALIELTELARGGAVAKTQQVEWPEGEWTMTHNPYIEAVERAYPEYDIRWSEHTNSLGGVYTLERKPNA